jgi:hypothetical protein
MSLMRADIRRIVSEDVSPRVNQYNVVYEAVTNSIQAGATRVVCTFNSNDNPIQDDGILVVQKRVDSITIVDDGLGFNGSKYESFCTYRSEANKELGCKGVGRLIFLKVYDKIEIISRMAEENLTRSFTFNLDFETESSKVAEEDVDNSSTEIRFSGVTRQYLDLNKGIDRRILLDIEKIKENVLLHLMPTLFFYKKKGAQIVIDFIDASTMATSTISPSDVPDLRDKSFFVVDKNDKQFDFILRYLIEKEQGPFNSYFCAHDRTVCEVAEKGLKVNLPKGYSGLFLVEGDYLRSHVNNDRNDFDIYPVRTDMFSPVSWEMINTALKGAISNLVTELIPETESLNKRKLEEIQNERPYLAGYIDERDIEMAGYLDKNQIVEKAKKRFDIAKEQLLASAGKDHYTDSELKDAIQITQDELVSYINDRALVLERLRSLVDKKERVEAVIHELFMEKRTEDDFFLIGKNNLWLIDDRFTTYSYAASDKTIKDVLSAIGEEIDSNNSSGDRPDLAIFFSANPDSESKLKSVLVEIKPFDFASKPDRKKFQGISQLVDYIRAFRERETVEEVFAYLITDIDTNLSERLEVDGYSKLYSHDHPIYHRYYDKLETSIFVVSARTLIADAEARNKIFLDIIRKQSKLNRLLGNNHSNGKKS